MLVCFLSMINITLYRRIDSCVNRSGQMKATAVNKRFSNYICCDENCACTLNNDRTDVCNESEVVTQTVREWKMYHAAVRNAIQDSLGCQFLHYLICEVNLEGAHRQPYLPSFLWETNDNKDLFSVITAMRMKHCCWYVLKMMYALLDLCLFAPREEAV